jgi:hypothetical protein
VRENNLNTQGLDMPGKTFNPDENIANLRQIEVLTSQGQSVAKAVRMAGISDAVVLPLAQGIRWASTGVGQTSQEPGEDKSTLEEAVGGAVSGQSGARSGGEGEASKPRVTGRFTV